MNYVIPYINIAYLNEFDKYPPFPHPELSEEQKEKWGFCPSVNEWICCNFPD